MRRNDANSFSVITSHIISSQFAIHDKKFPTKYYSHFAIASINETAARICKKYCWMPGNNLIGSTYCINSWWKKFILCCNWTIAWNWFAIKLQIYSLIQKKKCIHGQERIIDKHLEITRINKLMLAKCPNKHMRTCKSTTVTLLWDIFAKIHRNFP